MQIEPITQALAPGVALTSVIFYNTSLQNRFIYITGRIRELNREARGLLAVPAESRDPASRARLRSVRWQVNLMNRRALIVRRTILIVYCAFLCLCTTILLLLLASLGEHGDHFWGRVLSLSSFGGALCLLVAASIHSTIEMYLSHRTLREDIRNSFASPESASKHTSPTRPENA